MYPSEKITIMLTSNSILNSVDNAIHACNEDEMLAESKKHTVGEQSGAGEKAREDHVYWHSEISAHISIAQLYILDLCRFPLHVYE
jgi:hypothetical protein